MSFDTLKTAEWLETDGLGGFASGTAAGRRTRRYHALLLAATPSAGRFVLVNGFDAWLDTPTGSFAISSQYYAPDVAAPDGGQRLVAFENEPWPRWTYQLEDGTRIEQELFVPHGYQAVALRWRLLEPRANVTLRVRPFLSGRDYHALHRENRTLRFAGTIDGQKVAWRPYDGVPGTVAWSNGDYRQEPLWYRNFLYEEERARGLDYLEDLAAPGGFRWDLSRGEAVLLLSATGSHELPVTPGQTEALLHQLRTDEMKRRQQFPSRLHRAADAYIVRRGAGKTVIAGYPWFTDWGRDTFIAVRGLCLATGRLDDARDILVAWSATVSEGMLPNRFPDRGAAPEYNAVDAALWYVIAVHDYREAMRASGQEIPAPTEQALVGAVAQILTGYAKGTRYRIHLDEDGLLAAGQPGLQLTWMDSKVGDWVVTPRIGKPVEVQALWLNALAIGRRFDPRWQSIFEQGCRSFRARFWSETSGYLHDVVDLNHHPGAVDATLRPNQVLAVGGLPLMLLDRDQARRVVDAVEATLWTPLGLRSLAPGMPGYCPRYKGGVRERDGAYHQGTVWPWLLGPFVEAWVRVRGATPAAQRDAWNRFVQPILRDLDEAGLGHVSEIADGDAPHTPRGCPFQAWSVGEVLRLAQVVLAERDQVENHPISCTGPQPVAVPHR